MKSQHQHVSRSRLRWLSVFVVILVILWASAWGVASLLAPRLVRSSVVRLTTQVAQPGISLDDLRFESVSVSPLLNSIKLSNFHAQFDLNPRDNIRLKSSVDVDEIKVVVGIPFIPNGSVQVSGLEVNFDASDLPRSLPFDRFTNAHLKVGNLPLTRPRQAAQEISRKIEELFFENKAVGDLQFSGEVQLSVDEVEMVARLYSEQEGERFRLRFMEHDIQLISDAKGMNLVAEQVAIVSDYPLRVPVIMVITDRALDLAKFHEPDDEWLHDAHRHVTWSYLLTQHFGSEFALKVTDAQEMRPGNTPDERAMDYHNNAIGRKLFAKGVTLAALPRQIREHPDIIRHPNEVESFRQSSRLLR